MRYRPIFLLVVALLIVVAGTVTAPDLTGEITTELASDIVAALPHDDIHLRTLAVGEIEGRLGEELRTKLLNEISEKTDFVLVERAEVDKLLGEQSLQAGDLVDTQARVRFGKLLGAEGIVFGSVNKLETSWTGKVQMDVQVSLDDVELGEVVFAKEFTRAHTSTWNRWFLAAAALFVLCGLVGTFLRRSKTKSRHKRLDAASEKRIDAVSEIRQARRLLEGLQTRAHERGEEKVQALRDLRSALADVQQLVEVAASGDPDLHSKQRDKQLSSADKQTAKSLRAIRKRCEKLAANDQTPDQETLTELLSEIRSVEAMCRGRAVR